MCIRDRASRMYKILKSDQVIRLTSIEKGNGTYTSSVGETIEVLLEHHFPRDPLKETRDIDHEKLGSDIADKIVTTELVERAVASFKGFKSPGPDEIFPAMITWSLKDIKPHLLEVFKACL